MPLGGSYLGGAYLGESFSSPPSSGPPPALMVIHDSQVWSGAVIDRAVNAISPGDSQVTMLSLVDTDA